MRECTSVSALEIHLGDCLTVTSGFAPSTFDLIYIDPPYNTGRTQTRKRLRTVRAADGDRTGFQGNRYRTTCLGESSFADRFDDFAAFIQPRLAEAHRLLTADGSCFLHIDCREAHCCKVMLDGIFGCQSFINEIV